MPKGKTGKDKYPDLRGPKIGLILIICLSCMGVGHFGVYGASPLVVQKILVSTKQPDQDTELGKLEKKSVHAYKPESKLDPFAPFVLRRESGYTTLSPEELKKIKSLQGSKTELQRIDISDLRLVAVIKGKDKAWAMVVGPTGKGFVVKQGTGIGTRGGIADKIICEDKMTPLGKEAIRKIVIKEPFIGENGKLNFRYFDMVMGEKGDKK